MTNFMGDGENVNQRYDDGLTITGLARRYLPHSSLGRVLASSERPCGFKLSLHMYVSIAVCEPENVL